MNLIYILRIIVKVSASFHLTWRNCSFFCKMEDRTVDCQEGINAEDLLFDQNHSKRSAWMFCNSATLPRSKVVCIFFQATTLFTFITWCLIKLTFYKVSCDDVPFGVSVLSAALGYILPSPLL